MRLIATRRRRDSLFCESESGPPSFKRCYPALATSVAEARDALTAFAVEVGADRERTEAVRLVASEALTNVVRFAYPARSGNVHVNAWSAGGELWVLVADNGCGLHAGAESDGLGLGLALIAQLSDGFSIVERSSGGTELRLRFDLRASAARDRPRQPRGSLALLGPPASARPSA
jgi:anti-sigma regulatory factor (Ser/Thr protein kinase)